MATPILKTATPHIYDLGHRSQAMLERLAKIDIKISEQELQKKEISKQTLLAQIYSELNIAQRIVEFKHLPQTADRAVIEEFNREKNFLDMQVANKIYRLIISQLIQDSLMLFTQAEKIKKLNLLLQRLKSLASEERWRHEQSFAILETEKAKQAQIALLQIQASEKMHIFHHEAKILNKKVLEVRAQKLQLLDFYVNKMATSLANYTLDDNSKPFANATLAERQNFAREYLHQNHKLKRELKKRTIKQASLQQQKKELENQKRQLIKTSETQDKSDNLTYQPAASDIKQDGLNKTLTAQPRRAGALTRAFQQRQGTHALLHEQPAIQAIEEKLAILNQKIAKIETKRETAREKLDNLVAEVAKSCKIASLTNASYEELKQFKQEHADLRKKMHRERATLTDLNKGHKEEIKNIQKIADKVVDACRQSDTPLSLALQHNYGEIAALSLIQASATAKSSLPK